MTIKRAMMTVGQLCLVIVGAFVYLISGAKAPALAVRIGHPEWGNAIRLLLPQIVMAVYVGFLKWNPVEGILWYPRQLRITYVKIRGRIKKVEEVV